MISGPRPPFLICVPVDHSADWPGLAAGRINARLEQLGNPAGGAIKAALDHAGVIHFLSLSVVWKQGDPDPPVLVAHVAGDGTTDSIIAAIVKHAGGLLLPVFEMACGVSSPDELEDLLRAKVAQPVEAAYPLWPNRVTGLAFQGTPDSTVASILADEKIANIARAAVLARRGAGSRTARACLAAARLASGIGPIPTAVFNPRSMAVDPARAGAWSQRISVFRQFVFDWYFLVLLLPIAFFMNVNAFLGRIAGEKINTGWILNLRVFLEKITSDKINTEWLLYLNTFLQSIDGGKSNPGWLLHLTVVGLLMGGAWSIWGIYNPRFEKRVNTKFTSIVIFLALWPLVTIAVEKMFLGVALSVSASAMVRELQRLFSHPLTVWLALVLAVSALVLFVMVVVAILAAILRAIEFGDKPCDDDVSADHLADLMRDEDQPPHRQNHMIGVVRVRGGAFRRFVYLPAALYAVGLLAKAGIFKPGFLSEVGTIHFAQWACLPGTRQLYFAADYDGSWQSYLEDFITRSPEGASAIWSNCVGFPKTEWLFSKGAADGDRFKRWVRNQTVPTPFWYSAYPHLTATDIRINADICMGLEAETMAADDLAAWLKLVGSAPRPPGDIELDQIQGLVLGGYRELREGALLPVSFPAYARKACRTWLAGVSRAVVFGDGTRRKYTLAVALSASGLAKLGAGPGALAAQFSPPFQLGLSDASRANVLGDIGHNAPGRWTWGGPSTPVVDALLLIYAARPGGVTRRLAVERTRLRRTGLTAQPLIRFSTLPPSRSPTLEPFGFVDGISQPIIRGLRASRGGIKGDLVEAGEFILGYPDGRKQFPPTPQVAAAADPKNLLADLPSGFPQPPDCRPVRDLGQNGSYLVIRQLEQKVKKFNAFVATEGLRLGKTPDWVAAKMVGRWRNGAPLVMYPDAPPKDYDPLKKKKDETFHFGRDDPQGLACPFGAHIRRANPRDHFNPGDYTQMKITNRHRILRRGRRYKDENGEGLVFMCLNADIERQFEFLQQTWIGSPTFGALTGETDPLVGMNRMKREKVFTIPTAERPQQLVGLPSFVSVVGGGYFFLPGKRALAFLSA